MRGTVSMAMNKTRWGIFGSVKRRGNGPPLLLYRVLEALAADNVAVKSRRAQTYSLIGSGSGNSGPGMIPVRKRGSRQHVSRNDTEAGRWTMRRWRTKN